MTCHSRPSLSTDALDLRNPWGQTVPEIGPLRVCPFVSSFWCSPAHMLPANLCLFLQVHFKYFLFCKPFLSHPIELFSPFVIGCHLFHMFIPLVHCLSDSEMSYVHCAVTVSFSGKWALQRQDWCLIHLEPSAPKTGVTQSKCIDLVPAPKRTVGDRAGIWISLVMDVIRNTGEWVFLGFLVYLLTLLYVRSYLLLKFSFINSLKIMVVTVHSFLDSSLILWVWLQLLVLV